MDEQTDRGTEPGPILKSYERAKTALTGLIGRGKAEAKATFSSGEPQDDPVTSGHDWKNKKPEEVSEADDVRSQEEMKETFDGDGKTPSSEAGAPHTAVYEDVAGTPPSDAVDAPTQPRHLAEGDSGGPRGDVELPSADVHRGVGTDDNDDAPEMGDLEDSIQAELAEGQEDEDGRVPSDGLGLDDDPGARYASDTEIDR
ncbi:hypothetical protein [Parvularcula dongshanensis]|uniref:Uncharacterized protein n=1 Tax=Parvularcula dongshanensis TaxID=1173995 RepID=A0A840I714_9PROT|nr:hypothetical protein [Parvularcula dongshanensis]MBB4659964.1 hypothetical protein [Parvularcula dongshanensis]